MLSKFGKFKAVMLIITIVASLSMKASAQQELTFLSPDGKNVTLSGLRGKVAVLLFGSAQDPQCRDEFKALESLVERYQGKDVSIYWVNIDSPTGANKSPCGPASSVIVLRDQNRAAFKRFGGRQLPTIIVLNRQGEPHGQPLGGFNPNSDFINDLSAIVDSLLRQK